MTDRHEPSLLDFAIPDQTPRLRACEGGCGVEKMSPGPFWCSPCRERADAADLDREERSQLADALASIPTEWADATFNLPGLVNRMKHYERVDHLIRVARSWNLRATPMVTLASASGASGIGKTTIACAVFRKWLADRTIPIGVRKFGRFFSAPNLPRLSPVAFDEAMRLPAIVLDDLGGEGTNPTARDAVSQILRERQAWHRPTIVTTWMSEPELRATYGAGISRRLFERGECIAW